MRQLWIGICPVLAKSAPSWESVDGWYWPLGATLHLTIDDPNTPNSPDLEMDKIVTVVSDPPNNKSVWFNFAGIYDLKPGDRVTLTDGTTTRSLEVSILSIKSVNIETNIVTGIAEPGAIVRLPMPSEPLLQQQIAMEIGLLTIVQLV